MTVRQVTATMNLHPELRAQYDLVAADAGDANVHPDWRQMLLFPCSAYPSDTDEWSVDVCTSCTTSLNGRSEHPPKNSIANGNYRGFASKTPGLADVPEQVGVRRIRATLPLPPCPSQQPASCPGHSLCPELRSTNPPGVGSSSAQHFKAT